MQQKKEQIIHWVKTHKKESYIIAGVISLLLVGGVVFAISRVQKGVDRIDPNVDVKPISETVPSPLTGVEVKRKLAGRPVTMVVIENSPDARPQSGVIKAGVVFESIAEGGITRLVTLYQESRPNPLGPVRSLRPYFLDWALMYNAPMAHVGGSAQALEEVQELGMRDLDQFAHSEAYYRTSDRFAPHNMYTDCDLLDALNKKLGYKKSEFDSLPRKDDEPLEKAKAKNISINISSYTYQTDYIYKKNTNSYDRLIAGQPDKDRESGKIISPKVLIVINTPYTIAGDGRYHYDLIGKGKATIYQDGDVIKGNWNRTKRSSQFVFKDKQGKEISLNAGQTWVTAIAPDQAPTHTQ